MSEPKSIRPVDASEIQSKNIEVGEWGLTFKAQVTPKEWLDVALAIQKYDGKLQWYLGDLAVYAESPDYGFDVKNKEGRSKYDDMIEGTGYEKQTLKQYATVARRFSSDFRERVCAHIRDNALSFTHFHFVTSLDDNFAEYWLKRAAENAWGVAKLREEIRSWKEGRGETTEKREMPIGYISFNSHVRDFFKGWNPSIVDREYDRMSFLLEVNDVVTKELDSMRVVNVKRGE